MIDNHPKPDGTDEAPKEPSPPSRRGHSGQRASKSAGEAWAAELARDRAMSPRERMLLALELDEETEQLLAWTGRATR